MLEVTAGFNNRFRNESGAIFAVILIPLVIYNLFIYYRNEERRSYINAYQLLDTVQVQYVVKTLKVYFCCCAPSPTQSVALPSRLVNDLWRTFSKQNEDYGVFCQEAFRYKLPYQQRSNPNDNCRAITNFQLPESHHELGTFHH